MNAGSATTTRSEPSDRKSQNKLQNERKATEILHLIAKVREGHIVVVTIDQKFYCVCTDVAVGISLIKYYRGYFSFFILMVVD